MIEARTMSWPRIGEALAEQDAVDVEQVVAEARERGHAEGFEAGKAEGEAAGRAAYDAEIKAVVEPLEALQRTFEDYRLQLDAEERTVLAELLKKAFSALVREALLNDTRVLEDYIQAALDRFERLEHPSIRASMGMADALRGVGSELKVQVDESLPEFGIRLESESSTWVSDPVGDFDDLVDLVFRRGEDEIVDR